MSSSIQTIVALVLVAVAAGWLIYNATKKRRSSSCGGGECGAISPEVKKLQARLKR
jgi:attachment p12 family protein